MAITGGWFYSTDGAKGGAGMQIVIKHSAGTTTYLSRIMGDPGLNLVRNYRGIAHMLNTTSYEVTLPFMVHKPVNITQVQIQLIQCVYWRDPTTGRWYWWTGVVLSFSYSLNITVPHIGSGLYGINFAIRAWYQS